MKRMIYLIAIIFISTLATTSCTTQNENSSVPAVMSTKGDNSAINTSLDSKKSEIEVQSPMTLSNNECTFNGQSAYLRLKMVKGRYYEDWNPGAYMGTLWEGSFVIELADEYGKTIFETDISKMFSEPLVFNSSFNIEFDDYNNDGVLDFTIGQYASSNGRVYKIFTLSKDGKVEILPVKDHQDLFISDSTGYYSTRLNKVNGTTFDIEYYDNSEPATFHDYYQWDGRQFILVKSEKVDDVNKDGPSNSSQAVDIDNEFSLLSVKINGETVSPATGLINENGFNLELFCREIYPSMKMQILEYSNKTFGGYKGNKVPIKFKVSISEKSVEFEGVAYASPANGEPVAEYIAGKFGEVRAKYKNYLYLQTKESIGHFLDSLGIGFTFYDDKSIDIYK